MKTIGKLAEKRKIIKAQIKKLEKECEEVDKELMELLAPEAQERFKLNSKEIISVQRQSMKVWDMDKVYELIGNERKVTDVNKETGEVKHLELLSPNDSALKIFTQQHMLGEKYKAAYYLKGKKPFIKIDKL